MLSELKDTQSNTLCSGFSQNPKARVLVFLPLLPMQVISLKYIRKEIADNKKLQYFFVNSDLYIWFLDPVQNTMRFKVVHEQMAKFIWKLVQFGSTG